MYFLLVGSRLISGASIPWAQKLQYSASRGLDLEFYSKISSFGSPKIKIASGLKRTSVTHLLKEEIQTPFSYVSKVKLSVGTPKRVNPLVEKKGRHYSEFVNMSAPRYIVGHDQVENNFYILLDECKTNSGPTAKLEYTWIRRNLVDLYHTEVPPQFQGQGIAKILAKAAFDYFSEKEITMRPSCTYLQKYLRENPYANYLDHVEQEYVEKIKER